MTSETIFWAGITIMLTTTITAAILGLKDIQKIPRDNTELALMEAELARKNHLPTPQKDIAA